MKLTQLYTNTITITPRTVYRLDIDGDTLRLTYIQPGYEFAQEYDFPSVEAVRVIYGLGAQGWVLDTDGEG